MLTHFRTKSLSLYSQRTGLWTARSDVTVDLGRLRLFERQAQAIERQGAQQVAAHAAFYFG
jgi:hypothetical protein